MSLRGALTHADVASSWPLLFWVHGAHLRGHLLNLPGSFLGPVGDLGEGSGPQEHGDHQQRSPIQPPPPPAFQSGPWSLREESDPPCSQPKGEQMWERSSRSGQRRMSQGGWGVGEGMSSALVAGAGRGLGEGCRPTGSPRGASLDAGEGGVLPVKGRVSRTVCGPGPLPSGGGRGRGWSGGQAPTPEGWPPSLVTLGPALPTGPAPAGCCC